MFYPEAIHDGYLPVSQHLRLLWDMAIALSPSLLFTVKSLHVFFMFKSIYLSFLAFPGECPSLAGNVHFIYSGEPEPPHLCMLTVSFCG